jgi:branched-chain amino acid transport system permease protein
VLTVLATGATKITRGYAGVPADAFFMGIDAQPYLWLGLAILVVYFACQTVLMRSSFGLQAMAVRDREEVAEGLGVNTARIKLTLFVYTAFWAGVAGAFYAGYVGVVSPAIGQLIWMGWVVAMVVVGGLGSIAGPILGVALVRILDAAVRSDASEHQALIIALLLLVFLLFFPDGIVGMASRLGASIAAAREKRHSRRGGTTALHSPPSDRHLHQPSTPSGRHGDLRDDRRCSLTLHSADDRGTSPEWYWSERNFGSCRSGNERRSLGS